MTLSAPMVLATVFSAVSIAFAGDASSYSDETDRQIAAWAQTNLTLDLAQRLALTNRACEESIQTMMGCTWAMTALLNVKDEKPQRMFAPKSFILAHPKEFTGIEAEFPPFAIGIESADTENLKPEDFIRFRNERFQKTIQLITQGANVDFEGLFRRYRPSTDKNPRLDAWYASQVLNAFYAITDDSHTQIAPAQTVLKSESFFGVGFYVRPTRSGYYLIVYPGSPAAKAGLISGDILQEIDGMELKDRMLDKIFRNLRRLDDTPNTLSIRRNGQTLSFQVRRTEVSVPTVISDVYPTHSGQAGVIRLTGFLPDACTAVPQAIKELVNQGVQELILDLRDNRGGPTQSAQCVLSQFLGPGHYIADLGDGPFKTNAAKITDLPLVVLVNNMSASSAEIVAGVLQDTGRAVVVGQRSFGKGSYQIVADHPAIGNVTFLKTNGLYTFESGHSPQLTGIIPDFEIGFDTVAIDEKTNFAIREENLLIPLSGSPQVYTAPPTLAQTRAIRSCVLKETAKVEAQDRAEHRVTDLQMAAASKVRPCLESNLTLQTRMQSVVETGDCKGARRLKTEIMAFSRVAAILREKIAIGLASSAKPDIYERSVSYYRAQRLLAEVDVSAEAAAFEKPLATLTKKCANR